MKEDYFNLNYAQLARLWSIGVSEKDFFMSKDQIKENVRKAIYETVPLRSDQHNIMPMLLDRLHKKLARMSNQSLIEILQDPNTDLFILQSIKDVYKQLSRGDGEDQRDQLSMMVYFATIASALVYKDTRITSHSFNRLEKDFSQLIEVEWLPQEFKELFEAGIRKCRQYKDE